MMDQNQNLYEPSSYKQTIKIDGWTQAMKEEMEAFK